MRRLLLLVNPSLLVSTTSSLIHHRSRCLYVLGDPAVRRRTVQQLIQSGRRRCRGVPGLYPARSPDHTRRLRSVDPGRTRRRRVELPWLKVRRPRLPIDRLGVANTVVRDSGGCARQVVATGRWSAVHPLSLRRLPCVCHSDSTNSPPVSFIMCIIKHAVTTKSDRINYCPIPAELTEL